MEEQLTTITSTANYTKDYAVTLDHAYPYVVCILDAAEEIAEYVTKVEAVRFLQRNLNTVNGPLSLHEAMQLQYHMGYESDCMTLTDHRTTPRQ